MSETTEASIASFDLSTSNLAYETLEQLRSLAIRAQEDANVRVLVVNLDVKSKDPSDMGPWPARVEHRQITGKHGPGPIVEQDLVKALRGVHKPTLAVIRGNLCDFAIDIAAVCDIRIATETATVADSRVRHGQTAASGISYLLPRLIGLSQAMRISLLGESLSAREAHRIQFVHQVIGDEIAEQEIASWIERLSRMPTRAWEVHKLQVLPQLDQSFESAMVHSLGIRQTHAIQDRIEGIRAWRERREPRFTGQ